MRYLVSFVVPPLGILMCKRWGHAIVNLIFWLASFPLLFFMGIGVVVWLLCIAHALAVCRMSSVDKRLNRLVGAIQSRSQ
jgi:hypothetical protein